MRDRLLIISAAILVSALAGRAQTTAPPSAQTPPDKADQAALAVVTKVCTECHDLEQVNAKRRTRDGWSKIFDKMTTKGANGTDAEFDTILGYLLRHEGLVNVNAAPKDDLIAVLGVQASAADAIVAYRTSHGPFADFDAVANVPGVDRKALEPVRAAIAFSDSAAH
jgi:competence ComEA-like helix-hairpin-helix protein